ncbi:MAG: glycosyltransferase [Desulfosporosinus sp.]|nr:glycosyltransferase [Desulfosporosinus sp.]
MLPGHSIIYFSPEPWDGIWRNRQQLMSIFARQNKVLFVEPLPHLRPTLSGFRQGELGLYDLGSPFIRQVSENLFVFRSPVWAPISGRFPLKQLTKTCRRVFIQNTLRKLDMTRPIVMFSRPGMVGLVEEIPSYSLSIYHVVDEYAAYGNKTLDAHRRIQKLEQEMIALVDMVVVVSKKLYEAKQPLNANTYLVPNGVNFKAYTDALADPYLPEDIRVINPPRLGYSGLIGDRLDLAMLTELAQKNPQWSLVFLGEVRFSEKLEAWHALQTLPNIHCLGKVDVSQVPYYLKGFQAGLIPYAITRESEHISPLKLYDYLAVGMPVVSIDFPAAREFSDYINLADSPNGFTQAVQAALKDSTPERCQERRNVAAQHTWEARIKQLSDIIRTQLAVKASL